MMHICVSKLTMIGSDNGLSPHHHQAITWTNSEILLIRPLGTTFSEILIKIYTSSFKKMHLKMLSAKWQSFCLGLNVLTCETLLPLHQQTAQKTTDIMSPFSSDICKFWQVRCTTQVTLTLMSKEVVYWKTIGGKIPRDWFVEKVTLNTGFSVLVKFM